jgi:hypothetical protein
MSSVPLEQQLLLALQTCALIGLSIRLWRAGLCRKYPFFVSYLLLASLQTAVLSTLSYRSMVYRNAWLVTEGLIVCAYVLVVLELCKILFNGLPGITAVAQRYIQWTLVFSIIGSLLLLAAERAPVSMFGYFMTCERAVISSLVIFVLLMMLFLAYYRVPLNRNVIVYSIGYALYFLAKAAAAFLRNLSPGWYREISTALVGISSACLLFWLFGLSRHGETRAIVVGHQWSSESEERLMAHLKTVNASLGRMVPTLPRRVALPDEAD